jgi:hypothetical protein
MSHFRCRNMPDMSPLPSKLLSRGMLFAELRRVFDRRRY